MCSSLWKLDVSCEPVNNGRIYTPNPVAEFLSDWAIRSPQDKVLDLGTGPGVFVFQAHKRLQALGCDARDASQQIYGAEIDDAAWSDFDSSAASKGINFPHVANDDFFKTEITDVDAVIGNPPYVRRYEIDNVDVIRRSALADEEDTSNISRLTDLYVYFLLRSMQFLRQGGRLAVITADSWLNVGYGKTLRQRLTEEFAIERLISIDRPVFDDAQVKPVMLLATKFRPKKKWRCEFIRVKNGLRFSDLPRHLNHETAHKDIQRVTVPSELLTPENIWGIHFKAPELYDEITSHHLFTPLDKIARAQIGHQTLAKDFFVLTRDEARAKSIENRFLKPLAQSSQHCDHPVISKQNEARFYLFYCSGTKEKLSGTKALEYIEYGETETVSIRGKDQEVVGYHNKPRIQKASRKNWYDLRTRIEKRGSAEILIPRLVYKYFAVYWNQARYIPGELFIEFVPHETIDPRVYLAILNSTVTEVLFRCHAQVYGGGTYNMNSGEIKRMPIIDASLLSEGQRDTLVQGYTEFIQDPNLSRHPIDKAVASILGFDRDMMHRISETQRDLVEISTSTKLSHLLRA